MLVPTCRSSSVEPLDSMTNQSKSATTLAVNLGLVSLRKFAPPAVKRSPGEVLECGEEHQYLGSLPDTAAPSCIDSVWHFLDCPNPLGARRPQHRHRERLAFI